MAPVAREACRRPASTRRIWPPSSPTRPTCGSSTCHRPAARLTVTTGWLATSSVRQHLGRDDSAGAVAHGRARRDPVRRPRAAARASASGLAYRRPGRARSLTTPTHHPGRDQPKKGTVNRGCHCRRSPRRARRDPRTRSPTSTPSDVTDDKCFTDDLDVDSLSMVEVPWPPKRSSASRSPTTNCPS